MQLGASQFGASPIGYVDAFTPVLANEGIDATHRLGADLFGAVPIGAAAPGGNAAAVTLPAFVATAAGTVVIPPGGVGAVTLPALVASGAGTVEIPTTGDVVVTLPAFSASATGVYRTTGVGAAPLPGIDASLAGTASLPSTGQVTLPALSAALTGVSSTLADTLPTGATYYYCTLTGAADGVADVLLPMSGFSVRHRADSDSYYSVTIPGYSSIDAIVARSNGQIVISSDTGGVQEELMRGSLGDVRTDRGPNSQTISISGNASQAATATQTFVITSPSYAYSTFAGEQRLRITPRSAIRPGHYARYESTLFEIGTVTWSVSASAGNIAAQMEIATLAA